MIADYWLLDSFLLRLAGYFFWLWFMRLSFFRYCLATVWLRNWRSPEVMSVNWTPTPWLESPSLGWRIIDQITFPATLMVWRLGGLMMMKKLPSNGGVSLQEMKAPEVLTLRISPSILSWVVSMVTGHRISILGSARFSIPVFICTSCRERRYCGARFCTSIPFWERKLLSIPSG